LIILGQVSGAVGVKGWVRVYSHTKPRENIINFDTWVLRLNGIDQHVILEGNESRGKNVLAKVQGTDDRDSALGLVGAEITVERDSLQPCDPGEYYWADLEGLEVRTVVGQSLGHVDYLLSTGAHDVMVLAGDRERLIPFVLKEIVCEVDIGSGFLVVNWDPDF
jgi:16S rRNA processing protein RimM